MALIDVFDVAATPIVAFLVARDVCHLETLSKAWGDELRSLPSRDLWRNLFLKAFPAEASALLPLIVRGAPDADRRARLAYRNLATCGAAADSAIECAWMAGGPGQGPDEGRLPPRCHPRQADPFVLLLTAEGIAEGERRYAGIARWGTPEEFGRDSDTHEFEHLAVWEPTDASFLFVAGGVHPLSEAAVVRASALWTSCYLVDLATFDVLPLWRDAAPPHPDNVAIREEGSIHTGMHGASEFLVGVVDRQLRHVEPGPGVYAVKAEGYARFRIIEDGRFPQIYHLKLERLWVNFTPATQAYRGRAHLQNLLRGLLRARSIARAPQQLGGGPIDFSRPLDDRETAPPEDDEVASLRRRLESAELELGLERLRNERLRAATSYLAETAYMLDTFDQDGPGGGGHAGDSSDDDMPA